MSHKGYGILETYVMNMYRISPNKRTRPNRRPPPLDFLACNILFQPKT